MDKTEPCMIPPVGWHCTRPAGHPGPCAAVVDGGHNDKILKHFEYSHLPEHLQLISRPFQGLAHHLQRTLAPGPERSVALRKLLEAKDAAVRAKVHPGG